MQVKTYLDYSKNEIRNVALQCLASAPVNPVQGQIYYNTFDDLVYVYDTEWKAIGEGGGDVQSVNGKTGVVVLDAEDVGALPSTTSIPTKTSDLTNDSGFITDSYHDSTKQDVLPTVVKDRYLHTNENTGNLEWSEVEGGGVQTFVQNTEPQDAQIGDIWVNPDEISSITDYIVEEGTSGVWTYRKWNNGIAECWGKTTTNYAISNAMGSIYYGTYISYDYPTGLFIAEPSCHFDTSNNSPSANFTWVIVGRGGTEARTANIYIASAASRSANDITISVSAKGRWK